MTIYASIGELSFNMVGSQFALVSNSDPRMFSNNNPYESAYSRKGIGFFEYSAPWGTYLGSAQFFNPISLDGNKGFWWHSYQNMDHYDATQVPQMVLLCTADNRPVFSQSRLSSNINDQRIYAFAPDGSSAYVRWTALTNSNPATVDYYFDIPNDQVLCYQNGTLRQTLALDLNKWKDEVGAEITQFRFHAQGVSANKTSVTQVILADEPTLGWHVKTIAPEANGTHTEWVGDVTSVNEVNRTTTNLVSTDVAGKQTYTYTDIDPSISTNMQVEGVFMQTVGNGVSTALKLGNTIKVGAEEINYLSESVNDTGYSVPIVNFAPVNPITGKRWTFDELNNAEFGFRAET